MAQHDARVRRALISLDAATQALLAFYHALPPALTTQVLVGGWTPARHLWHIALVHDVFSGVLRSDGPVTATPGTSDFTDAEWSFNSPPPVATRDLLVPPTEVTAPDAQLRESVAVLQPLIERLDAKLGVQTVQLTWGRVSVYQMVEWAGGHTLRHLTQIGRELHRAGLQLSVGA